MTMDRILNYIDGKLIEPVSGQYLDNVDPSTGKVYSHTPDSDERDVEAAVEAAARAFPEWSRTPAAERSRVLLRIADLIEANLDELALAECVDNGKPLSLAKSLDIPRAALNFRFFATAIVHTRSEMHATDDVAINYTLRQPLGVAGIISPWNLPLYVFSWKVAPALCCGNTVVAKPSEVTPFSALLLDEIFAAVGLPEGVFTVVTGDGETGAALVDAGVDKISFTGSVRTGRRVAEACGRNLTPCTLELGGKDPMVVCADADLDRAARGAVFGAFSNSGQVCTSTERVYVVDEVAEAFTAKCVELTSELRQGSSGEFDVGAIIWPGQIDIIESHVRDAVEKGARVLTGGRRNPNERGYFWEPTVLVDVDHDMAIMRDETFGPVLPIMRVTDENEALRFANETGYGLNANVWTKDKHRGFELARSIESGSVVVNDCMITYGVTESPFGGVKQSGIGRVNGEMGLKGYCNVQSIVIDRMGAKSEPLWYPYSNDKLGRMKKMMRFLWGTSLGRFLS